MPRSRSVGLLRKCSAANLTASRMASLRCSSSAAWRRSSASASPRSTAAHRRARLSFLRKSSAPAFMTSTAASSPTLPDNDERRLHPGLPEQGQGLRRPEARQPLVGDNDVPPRAGERLLHRFGLLHPFVLRLVAALL